MLAEYADRWALITGASSGIGAEFARRLAARGMHVVLAARREELMQELAEELHTRHGTKSEIIVTDLSLPGEPQRLLAEVEQRGIEIELLVNNAGFGFVGELDDTNVDRILELIRLNISALTDLTYRVLPGMLQRGHGGIVNVASLAAFQPVAYMGAYAASKAFVLHFSEALWSETRERGVTVLALCPGTTRTEFFDIAGVPGWLRKRRALSTGQVVKAALKALDKGRQYVVPGWGNYLLSLTVRLARRKMVVKQSMRFFRPTSKNRQVKPKSDS